MNYDDFDNHPVISGPVSSRNDLASAVIDAAALRKASSKSVRERASQIPILRHAAALMSMHGSAAPLYKKRDDADLSLVSLWIAGAKHQAELLSALDERLRPFHGLSNDSLGELRGLLSNPENIPSLGEHLLALGIVLVIEDSLPSLKADGAAFKTFSGNPVVALSIRHNRYDNFCFTLMHELAHIALHFDKLDNPIVDDLDTESDAEIELEANDLAGAILISPSDWRTCRARATRSIDDINEFSSLIGSHPTIVAGRLRRDLNRYDLFTDIVNSIDIRKALQLNA